MTVATETTVPAVNIDALIASLEGARAYFQKSTEVLAEEDSTFAPSQGGFTVAAQVAHVAETIDWFFDGAVNEEGFDLNFEEAFGKSAQMTSLAEARNWLEEAFKRGFNLLRTRDDAFWAAALPEGPVMGGAPRFTVVNGVVEHTAHHRGALTVYSRLLGKVPPMPYM